MKKRVKVTVVGYFDIREDELLEVYEASSFDEALENQRNFVKDGAFDPSELFSEKHPTGFQLEFVEEPE